MSLIVSLVNCVASCKMPSTINPLPQPQRRKTWTENTARRSSTAEPCDPHHVIAWHALMWSIWMDGRYHHIRCMGSKRESLKKDSNWADSLELLREEEVGCLEIEVPFDHMYGWHMTIHVIIYSCVYLSPSPKLNIHRCQTILLSKILPFAVLAMAYNTRTTCFDARLLRGLVGTIVTTSDLVSDGSSPEPTSLAPSTEPSRATTSPV